MNQKWEESSSLAFDRFLTGLIGFELIRGGPMKIMENFNH